MKPIAELIAVPGKSFPALVFADGFRDLPAGTKLYAETEQDSVDARRYRWLKENIHATPCGWSDSEIDRQIATDMAIAAMEPKEK